MPLYVAEVAARSGHSTSAWASGAGMIYNVGVVGGYISFGFLPDRFGRKRSVLFSSLVTEAAPGVPG
jgi:MFS family permease